MFGSDVSHWDVVDMTEPVGESWEHVEHGRMTERDFRDFVFTNAVALHAGANPRFFDGTVVEAAVQAELAVSSSSGSGRASASEPSGDGSGARSPREAQ
jgi:hypothetical protein